MIDERPLFYAGRVCGEVALFPISQYVLETAAFHCFAMGVSAMETLVWSNPRIPAKVHYAIHIDRARRM